MRNRSSGSKGRGPLFGCPVGRPYPFLRFLDSALRSYPFPRPAAAKALAITLIIAFPGFSSAKERTGDGQQAGPGVLEHASEATAVIPGAERLEWTWLAAGSAVFLGAAAGLTAMDARALERDLHELIDGSRQRPVSGAAMVDLKAKTERRALQANALWAAAALGALVTVGLLHLELGAKDEPDGLSLTPNLISSNLALGGSRVISPGLLLEWRMP